MLTYAFMAIFSPMTMYTFIYVLTYMFAHWCLCTDMDTQICLTFTHCPPHTAMLRSPQTGTDSPHYQAGRYTYSHHCILTLSYTQLTGCSLTLTCTFLWPQQAPAYLHSHWHTQPKILTKVFTFLHTYCFARTKFTFQVLG